MKRQKLIGCFLAVLLFLFACPLQTVEAAEEALKNVSIRVQLNEDGSARITEKRLSYLVDGTENYIPIGNLGDSDIIDFVVEEAGQTYEFVPNWDLDWSREEKAFKNGLIPKNNGYELSWGIGEYGEHEYILSYTVTNFVKETKDDQQIMFWRFVNDKVDAPAENVSIVIEGNEKFDQQDEKVWAFGFEGHIAVNDGKIEAQSTTALTKSDYVTILARFPEGTFQVSSKLPKTFEEIKDQAFEGSDYGSGDKKGSSTFLRFIQANFALMMLVVIFSFNIFRKMTGIATAKPSTFKRKYKEEYYRDLPYDGPISDIYYILWKMGASDFEKVLTGYLLKWIHEDRLEATQVETGRIFKKESTHLRIKKSSGIEDPIEKRLFKMVIEAAGKDNVLEEKEFSHWAKKNISTIEQWKKDIRKNSLMKLQELEFIQIQHKKVLFFFDRSEHVLTDKGEELEKHVYQFINYLHDFSLMNEHDSINVKLWDNLMIWAGVFGITEQVMKEFKKIYPNYEVESSYRGGALYYTSSMSRTVSRSAVRSSGGGGSSSSGGGGGSFGGGSGGGTR